MNLKFSVQEKIKTIFIDDAIEFLNKHRTDEARFKLIKNIRFYGDNMKSKYRDCLTIIDDLVAVRIVNKNGTAMVIERRIYPEITILKGEEILIDFLFPVEISSIAKDLIVVQNDFLNNTELAEKYIYVDINRDVDIDFSESFDEKEKLKDLSTFLEFNVEGVVNYVGRSFKTFFNKNKQRVFDVDGIGDIIVGQNDCINYDDFVFIKKEILKNRNIVIILNKKLEKE